MLGYQFLSEQPPASPYPACGPDPTDDDDLSCNEYTACE